MEKAWAGPQALAGDGRAGPGRAVSGGLSGQDFPDLLLQDF